MFVKRRRVWLKITNPCTRYISCNLRVGWNDPERYYTFKASSRSPVVAGWILVAK